MFKSVLLFIILNKYIEKKNKNNKLACTVGIVEFVVYFLFFFFSFECVYIKLFLFYFFHNNIKKIQQLLFFTMLKRTYIQVFFLNKTKKCNKMRVIYNIYKIQIKLRKKKCLKLIGHF